MKKFKIMLPVLMMALWMSLFPVNVHAEEAAEPSPADAVTVFVRVESSQPGNEGTVLPRTEVRFDEGANHSALEALLLAMDGDVTIDTGEYGAFISAVGGISDETGQMSWMFAVNDELPWVSIDAQVLQNNDELVVYFIDWQLGSYAYFTPNALSAEAGKPFTLTLTGNHFESGLFPVDAAELFIEPVINEGDPVIPMPRNIIYTQEDGTVELTLYHPAVYHISARKSEPDGVSVLSRPFCEVTVTESESPQVQVEATQDDNVTLLPAAPETPEALPGLTLPVIYDPETGSLQLYGETVVLEESMRPIYEDGVLLLPVRAVVEALGGTVEWNGQTRAATVRFNDSTFSYRLDDTVGGRPVKALGGRTFLPADFLVEKLNLEPLLQFLE